MPLDSIRALINQDLKAIDQFIISKLESNIPLIRQVIEYVLSCGGKRIRPMVLLLSARALTNPQEAHIDLAAVIELIHTATLLHDDVVDHSTLRRGHQTAHTIWGSGSSVLIGDFLYSRAFQIVVDLKHPAVLDIFAKATHYMAEGEIMQLANCRNPDTTEAFYFEIIQRKTAKLFEIAAQLGAILTATSERNILALRDYGLHLGLAYQLIDDALDYSQSPDETGKNMGQDLAEGKMTLPLIYTMQKSHSPADRALLRKTIETGRIDEMETILGMIESAEAIKYTARTAQQHALLANEALAHLPATPYRQALEDLSHFVVNRTY